MDSGAQRFDYRVVSSICAISGVVLVGFAISHAFNKNYALFLLIGGFAALLISFAWYSWANKAIAEGPTYSVLAGANIVTLVGLYYLQGVGIYWVYPVVAVNFAFLQPKQGLVANFTFGAVAMILATTWAPVDEIARIGLTYFILMMFGFSFSYYLTQQHDELRRLANLDPLTGIGNRRALQREMEESIVARERYGQCASLLVMDLDHFKEINDEVGHVAGDRVLCRVVDLLQRRLRQTDHVYRYGGEEFVILTPHTRLENATLLAEQIRRSIETLEVDANRPITVSLGVAELSQEETVEDWLDRGDQALYRAKSSGRNRTVSLTTHPARAGEGVPNTLHPSAVTTPASD